MSLAIFPEKFAMYFANMNSLSGKIYSDIKNVEESIPNPSSLTYSEKCAVLDKSLVHDVLQKVKISAKDKPKANANGHVNSHQVLEVQREKLNFANFLGPNSEFEQDQVRSLLLAVYPKNPEKYVFEENGVWVDEYSYPFSFCKKSQTKSCRLAELITNLPVELTVTKNCKSTTEKVGPDRSQIISTKRNSKISEDSESEPDAKPKITRNKSKPKAKPVPSFFGVNVMGFGIGGSENQNSVEATSLKISSVITTPSGKQFDDKHELDDGEEESNLPKQKQNLELIAELQAKLKKTNSGGNSGSGVALHVESSKVSKPKAPPPPPPAEICAENAVAQVIKDDKICQDEENKTKMEIPVTDNKSRDIVAKQAQKSPLLQSNLKKNISKEPEFCVDVSSPCRIATPKTGLDFLDNW